MGEYDLFFPASKRLFLKPGSLDVPKLLGVGRKKTSHIWCPQCQRKVFCVKVKEEN